MVRTRLQLPATFAFSTQLPVRITDVNYGGHVGNDTILTLLHEARVQYLQSLGYSELDFAGAGLIMSDAVIEFKNELFYGNPLTAFVTADEFTRVSFAIFYRLVVEKDGKEMVIATAKTGMVCFDYDARKVLPVPAEAIQKIKG
jgi:acyl-CoA thioester hydrolase